MNIKFNNVYVENVSTVAGPFVIEGPLKDKYDKKFYDYYDGEKTFEQCEMKELNDAVKILLNKTNKNEENIDFAISADLMNQITISNYTFAKLNIPFLGTYNACASMCENILLAGSIIEAKKAKNGMCTTSSHNMTAERQYRNPVEYGAPKPKTTTFTVTGATALLLTSNKTDIKVSSATIGKVIDMGVTDVFDMGSVMSPSAAYTLNEHLKSTNTTVDDYDLILTGDLGVYGKEIFREYCDKEYGIKLKDNYDDSATIIYDFENEDVYAGGSGPSCLPLVTYSDIIPKMKERLLKKVLLIATGALMSPTTNNQKLSIPSVSHAVCLEVI